MIVYIAINLLFGIPIAAAPRGFFDFVGMAPNVADDLGGMRWLGASLLAWGVSGIIVLMRPEGRSTFVTAGALQLTAAAVALLYSWSAGEYEWSTWFQAVATIIVLGGAVYLGFARLAGRKVLKGA
jgi:CHASE2 domain-containing sensor protein